MKDWTTIENHLNQVTSDKYQILHSLDNNQKVFLAKFNNREYRVVKLVERHMLNPSYIGALLELDAPNVSNIFFIEPFEDFYIIVKEYVEGITLYQYIEEEDVLDEDYCIRITLQLIESLDYLHNLETHLIYRDIQPKNVIIDDRGQPVLIDTESIRMFDESKSQDTVMIGTAGFIAPEQFGYNQSSVQTDIFSLGALMYYSLTGNTMSADAANTMNQNPGISKRLGKIIVKMSRFSPSERYQSFAPIKKELKKIIRLKKLPAAWILVTLPLLLVIITGLSYYNYVQYEDTLILKREIRTQVETMDSLEKELEDYKTQLADEQGKVESGQMDSATLQEEIDSLEAELEEVKEELATTLETLTAAELKIEELENPVEEPPAEEEVPNPEDNNDTPEEDPDSVTDDVYGG